MKKKNGFTLIELLAVIIILGVLMLVAIPSVTSYINNSRKSAYADTAANYIKGATNLVNEGQKVQLYSEGVLYLIPVGHNTAKSCVALESGGQSPYNNEYDLAYVGVTYNNTKGSYNYYFTSVDGSGQGFEFNSSYDVSGTTKGDDKRGSDLVVAGLGSYAGTLRTLYNKDDATAAAGGKLYCVNDTLSKCNGTGAVGEAVPNGNTDEKKMDIKQWVTGDKKVITDQTINYVVVFATGECNGGDQADYGI